ncbi:hypothetical protein [Haliangium sp.]|uniref:hypothetical protein n=1 Tax=Haliangium sp. TaxID=2663208 RepID=UPI003D10AC2C
MSASKSPSPSQARARGSQEALPAQSWARYGCYLGFVAALLLLAYALSMLLGSTDEPMPKQLAFLLAGGLQAYLCLSALRRRRVAWAFALSMDGTLGAVFLLGVAKIRDGFEVPMSLALLPAVGFAVITTLLAIGAEDYDPAGED